jgi:hypothetical protein
VYARARTGLADEMLGDDQTLLPAATAPENSMLLSLWRLRFTCVVAQEAKGASGRLNKLQANMKGRREAAFLFDGLELKILRRSVTNLAAFRRGRFSFAPI